MFAASREASQQLRLENSLPCSPLSISGGEVTLIVSGETGPRGLNEARFRGAEKRLIESVVPVKNFTPDPSRPIVLFRQIDFVVRIPFRRSCFNQKFLRRRRIRENRSQPSLSGKTAAFEATSRLFFKGKSYR